jgi:CHAD domain-containing protein
VTTSCKRKGKGTRRFREAVEAIIADRFEALWKKEAAARSFADPEGVHEMRVASRRLRAALDASRDVFPRKWFAPVRATVKTMTRALGDVRDADVLLAELEARQASANAQDQAGLPCLIVRVTRERDDARTRLFVVLDDLDRQRVRELTARRFTRSGKGRLRRRDARRMVQPRVEAFLPLTRALPGEQDADGLHRLRIVAKRLRYTLQLDDDVFGVAGDAAIGDLTQLQDRLGEIHNLDVLIDVTRREMHAITDDAIARAMSTDPPQASTDDTKPGLLALLADTSRQRHERYVAFAELWNADRMHRLNEDLMSITRKQAGAS